jgi:hypothetical protein
MWAGGRGADELKQGRVAQLSFDSLWCPVNRNEIYDSSRKW